MLKDLDLSLDSEAKHLAFISPITLQKFLLVRVCSHTPHYVHYNKYAIILKRLKKKQKNFQVRSRSKNQTRSTTPKTADVRLLLQLNPQIKHRIRYFKTPYRSITILIFTKTSNIFNMKQITILNKYDIGTIDQVFALYIMQGCTI